MLVRIPEISNQLRASNKLGRDFRADFAIAANAIDETYEAFIADPTAERLQALNGLWARGQRLLAGLEIGVQPVDVA